MHFVLLLILPRVMVGQFTRPAWSLTCSAHCSFSPVYLPELFLCETVPHNLCKLVLNENI